MSRDSHLWPPGYLQRLDEVIAAFEQAHDEGAAPHSHEWARKHPDVAASFLYFVRDRLAFPPIAASPGRDTPNSHAPQSIPRSRMSGLSIVFHYLLGLVMEWA